MVPTPPARPSLPSPDYRRGLTVGVLVSATAGVLGWLAGDLAAVLVLTYGFPLTARQWAPVVTLVLAVLVGLTVLLAGRGRGPAYKRGVTVGIFAALALFIGSRALGAATVDLIHAAGLPEGSRLILVPLPAVALVLLIGAGVVALGRRLS